MLQLDSRAGEGKFYFHLCDFVFKQYWARLRVIWKGFWAELSQ